jgi:hypothetical protein
MSAAVAAAIALALEAAQVAIQQINAHHAGITPLDNQQMASAVASFNLAVKRSQDLANGIIDP